MGLRTMWWSAEVAAALVTAVVGIPVIVCGWLRERSKQRGQRAYELKRGVYLDAVGALADQVAAIGSLANPKEPPVFPTSGVAAIARINLVAPVETVGILYDTQEAVLKAFQTTISKHREVARLIDLADAGEADALKMEDIEDRIELDSDEEKQEFANDLRGARRDAARARIQALKAFQELAELVFTSLLTLPREITRLHVSMRRELDTKVDALAFGETVERGVRRLFDVAKVTERDVACRIEMLTAEFRANYGEEP